MGDHDWYQAGLAHGIELGRRQVEDEQAVIWAVCAQTARTHAERPSYAQRCDMAGEHDRAERARRRLAENGVTS
ncbi:hypothetical protein [Isoptericola sediminis]|uniref:Uncharacterized protein n=1 Tax=Isoptericola sediminis TaxID=2733572 RepID=A0A849K7P3_9MICO|nr:hypothetical protein [Isoptericola sediminis]NNU28460.1 hypothetical protein [Isoptericola sediminis]